MFIKSRMVTLDVAGVGDDSGISVVERAESISGFGVDCVGVGSQLGGVDGRVGDGVVGSVGCSGSSSLRDRDV